MNITVKKPEYYLVECAKSLGESCIIVGGCPVSLEMSLAEFIDTYGRNGIVFSISKEKLEEINNK
jgi:hypothetical protein